MPRLFVSHSSKDAWVGPEIIDRLRARGVDTWYSAKDVRGADAFNKVIISALQKCDWFAVVMTPNAASSDWVRGEVDWAITNRSGRIIPIVARKCQPEEFSLALRTVQMLDYRRNPITALDEVARRVGTGARPARAKPMVSVSPAPRRTLPSPRMWRAAALAGGIGVAVLTTISAVHLLISNDAGASGQERSVAARGDWPAVVHFALCGARISPEDASIRQVVDWLGQHPLARVHVIAGITGAERMEGDCDEYGPPELANARASAVREALRQSGIDYLRITVEPSDDTYSTDRSDQPEYRIARIIQETAGPRMESGR